MTDTEDTQVNKKLSYCRQNALNVIKTHETIPSAKIYYFYAYNERQKCCA